MTPSCRSEVLQPRLVRIMLGEESYTSTIYCCCLLLFIVVVYNHQACDSSIMSSTMSGNECSCPDVPMTEMDFIPVTLPFRMAYDFGNLSAFTNFCVQAIGNYTTEVTDGIGRLVATASMLETTVAMMIRCYI